MTKQWGVFGGMLHDVRSELPRVGQAGSRSALLHIENSESLGGNDGLPPTTDDKPALHRFLALQRFVIFRWAGTTGVMLMSLGGLGAGALPVVGNPYYDVPFGSLFARMLQASSSLVLIGVGLVVVSWILMAPLLGVIFKKRRLTYISQRQLWLTFLSWSLPLLITTPLFTQDIYSYLANGSIVRQGLDPYSAGPVQLLGADNELARSVPFIWSNSPSPYGPVALGIAAVISGLTSDSIMLGVFAHRIVSLCGVAAAGWALVRIAKRCSVSPETALWLAVLNPLTILHLIGGIHNEAIMMGLGLVGAELCFAAMDQLSPTRRWGLLALGGMLIALAGMVKVTGFVALGFVGMLVARDLSQRCGYSVWRAITIAASFFAIILAASIALVSFSTGISPGWIVGQGGAVTIRSWMSMSTNLGVIAGFGGTLLGFGDHTEAMLTITRGTAVVIAVCYMARMLFASYRGTIHPMGGWGVSMFVLVILFPVVHPWYLLWAIYPLAAWANRRLFHYAVIAYSGLVSFMVLPRGLGLPPLTVLQINIGFLLGLISLLLFGWVLLRRRDIRVLD